MPDINNYHAFESTTGGSSGGSGEGLGWGWIVIVIVAIMLVFFIVDGATFDAIDSLLGIGFLAFIVVRWLTT
jgi:hypothetical protein